MQRILGGRHKITNFTSCKASCLVVMDGATSEMQGSRMTSRKTRSMRLLCTVGLRYVSSLEGSVPVVGPVVVVHMTAGDGHLMWLCGCCRAQCSVPMSFT
jgi:hypothetical protein